MSAEPPKNKECDRDDSHDEKGFLSRWSQRKQEAKHEHAKPPPQAEPASEKAAEPEFDGHPCA